jgi:crossover junction endodeoxyribonuclease RusA
LTEFVIPGDPIPKGRPRFNPATGHAHTPTRTKDYENWVGLCAKAARVRPHAGDVVVELEMRVSLTKAGHRRKIDIDNCIKAILDGLNGVAWEDDSQVRGIRARMEDVGNVGQVKITIFGEEALLPTGQN